MSSSRDPKMLYTAPFETVLSTSSKIQNFILYGSRARGNFKPGSDIDLALVDPKMTIPELFQLQNKINDTQIPQKVDLTILHFIEYINLLEQIKKEGIEF